MTYKAAFSVSDVDCCRFSSAVANAQQKNDFSYILDAITFNAPNVANTSLIARCAFS